jgi:medium-chain acyl-[acyl-carrier-protein] hydrolase
MSHSLPSSSSALLWHRRTPAAKLRLFCFPYAGGGASIYNRWPEGLPPEIDVCAIQLPGRETRWGERPFTSLDAAIEALVTELAPELKMPAAFFGHSMGAIVAFELTHRLRDRDLPGPKHLVVSGAPAPHARVPREPRYLLDDASLAAALAAMDTETAAALLDPELRDMMLPVVRADFAIVETYQFVPRAPLAMPVSAFGGLADADISPDQVEAWRELTSGPFRRRMFQGGHFYLRAQRPRLLSYLASDLLGSPAPTLV